jgi:hypothetical protein
VAFPTTSVLDNFDRANNPSLGANWTFGVSSLRQRIAGNAVGPDTDSGNQYADDLWAVSTFTDSEAFITVTVVGGARRGVYVRMDESSGNGYSVEESFSTANEWGIYRYDGSVGTLLGTVFNQTYVAGDSIGLEMIGTTLKAYFKPSGGSWAQFGSTQNSSTYTSGKIGCFVQESTSAPRNDDFGGGAVTAAAASAAYADVPAFQTYPVARIRGAQGQKAVGADPEGGFVAWQESAFQKLWPPTTDAFITAQRNAWQESAFQVPWSNVFQWSGFQNDVPPDLAFQLGYENAFDDGGFQDSAFQEIAVAVGGGADIQAAGQIASGEAFGVANVIRILRAAGLVSAETFGTTRTRFVVQAAGAISSTEAFGQPDVLFVVRPTGITSSEAFGLGKLLRILRPTGLASAEAFGTTRPRFVVQAAGKIATAEAFGQPTLTSVYLITNAGGIASAEAFGDAKLLRILRAAGIASAEAVGQPKVLFVVKLAGGIGTAEAFGQPTLTSVYRITNAGGIASAEAFGADKLLRILRPLGITSAEAFGVARLGIRGVGAIASLEAFGLPRVLFIVKAAGALGSQEAFGSTRSMRLLRPIGIAGQEALGTPQRLNRILRPGAISSTEAFGSATLVRIIRVVGLTSGESFGVALLAPFDPDAVRSVPGDAGVSDRRLYDVLIADGETWLVTIDERVLFDANASESGRYDANVSERGFGDANVSDKPGG